MTVVDFAFQTGSAPSITAAGELGAAERGLLADVCGKVDSGRRITIVHATGSHVHPITSRSCGPASSTSDDHLFFRRGVRDGQFESDTRHRDPKASITAAYRHRIDQLRQFATEDGIELSARSESDFFEFACHPPRTKVASLVLLDSGNLRAVWRSGEQEVGAQFYGDGTVQYLISSEGEDGDISHIVRRGTFEEFCAAIEAADLVRLLYE